MNEKDELRNNVRNLEYELPREASRQVPVQVQVIIYKDGTVERREIYLAVRERKR